MAKRKRKEQEPAEAKGDAHEPQSASAADLSGPWDGAGTSPAPDGQPQPADDRPGESPGRQQPPQSAEKKPRSVIGRYFKDRRVQLIDDGNADGLGIKLSYDDPNARPSDAVKQILKEGDEKRPGFTYRGDLK
jgi:hypothetical protein